MKTGTNLFAGEMFMTQHKHVGSLLDDLLESDGTLEQVEAEALNRVIVWQIQQAMGHTGIKQVPAVGPG